MHPNDLERDPCYLLLNQHGFRGKFHIYEIQWTFDSKMDGPAYTVRKQLLDPFLSRGDKPQEIITSEKYAKANVAKDDLAAVYDCLRDLTIPLSRTRHAGIDGASYAIQIGLGKNRTIIHWWSDREPELESVYKLRDKIIKTVNQLLKERTGQR